MTQDNFQNYLVEQKLNSSVIKGFEMRLLEIQALNITKPMFFLSGNITQSNVILAQEQNALAKKVFQQF